MTWWVAFQTFPCVSVHPHISFRVNQRVNQRMLRAWQGSGPVGLSACTRPLVGHSPLRGPSCLWLFLPRDDRLVREKRPLEHCER